VRQVEQAEAKESACVCISQLIHATAVGLLAVNKALGSPDDAADALQADNVVLLAVTRIVGESVGEVRGAREPSRPRVA
jgi:hypothetical protein